MIGYIVIFMLIALTSITSKIIDPKLVAALALLVIELKMQIRGKVAFKFGAVM